MKIDLICGTGGRSTMGYLVCIALADAYVLNTGSVEYALGQMEDIVAKIRASCL